MKRLLLLLTLLGALGAQADEAELQGLITNGTITRSGQEFYVKFCERLNDTSRMDFNLAVKERPSARWGVLAVPVSFLTVGIQSVIQLSAGVARMPLRRYVAATAAGAIAWAAVYTTIGMAILTAWLTGPTGRLICLLMLTALALVVVIRRSRVMRAGRGGGRRERV